jgi:hypothetical protein
MRYRIYKGEQIMKKGMLLCLAGMIVPCFCFGWSNGAKVVGDVTNGNIAVYDGDANLVDTGVSAAGVISSSSLVQTTGTNTATVMSQNATTLAITNAFNALTNSQAYGSVYIHDGTNTVNLTTTNYVAIQMWSTNSPASKATPFNTVPLTNGIRVLSDGVYSVAYSLSMTGQNNSIVEAAVFVDEVEQTTTEFKRKISTGADVGSASALGQLYLTSNQVVSVRRITDTAGAYVVVQGQLVVSKIGLTVQELPIVQTVAAGTSSNVISGAGVIAGLGAKYGITNDFISVTNSDAIYILMVGQSWNGYTTDGTNALTGELGTGITNTYIVDQLEVLSQFNVRTNILYPTGATNNWGPEVGFAQSLRDRTGKAVYVARGYRSASEITNFTAGGAYRFQWTNAVNRMSAIFPAAGTVDAVVMMEGGTDSGTAANATNYLTNLRAWIRDIRSTPNMRENTPFFIYSLPVTSGSGEFQGPINAAIYQVAKEDPYVVVVTNGDIATSSDFVHYAGTNQLRLGYRFADYIYAYMSNSAALSGGYAKSENVTASDIIAGNLTLKNGFAVESSLTPISEHGLLAYIPLRGSYADVSTNAHTNVVTGTIVWDTDEYGYYAKTTNESYAIVYGFPTISNSDFSVSFAVKRNWGLSGGLQTLVSFSSGFQIIGGASSALPETQFRPYINIKDTGGTVRSVKWGTLTRTNEFDHYGVSVDRNGTNTVIRLYYEGVLTTTWYPAFDLSVSAGAANVNLTLGGTASNTFLNGGLRDVTIYQRILLDKEFERLNAIQDMNGAGIRGVE